MRGAVPSLPYVFMALCSATQKKSSVNLRLRMPEISIKVDPITDHEGPEGK
jgi:hypothetical protein